MRTIQNIRFYLVHTDKANPNHHGIRGMNPAPYVLTFEPGPGDHIWTVGLAHVYLHGQKLRVWAQVTHGDEDYVSVTSHLGRPVALGEDQADAAFGDDHILPRLIGERWAIYEDGESLAPSSVSWKYAPVDARVADGVVIYDEEVEPGPRETD